LDETNSPRNRRGPHGEEALLQRRLEPWAARRLEDLILRSIEGAEPQSVSVALDGCKPLAKIARIVADRLTQSIAEDLKAVRKPRANG
jgi:hypothetical protein